MVKLHMRHISATLIALTLFVPATVRAGAELDFWHSYTNRHDGCLHYSFHLINYTRGLFLGHGGPTTKLGRWAYKFDLAGNGPVFQTNQIVLSPLEGRNPIPVVAGTIVVDAEQGKAKIDLQVEQQGKIVTFDGNGTHRIKKIEGK